MSLKDLVAGINNISKDRINFVAYDLRDTLILFGVPPSPIKGVDYVFAQHLNPQNVLIMGLTAKGVFASNLNTSGIIELGLMRGSPAAALIEVTLLSGIPVPISIIDEATSGTSTVLASACRRTDTPQWRRGAVPDLEVYTFSTPRLIMTGGLRNTE